MLGLRTRAELTTERDLPERDPLAGVVGRVEKLAEEARLIILPLSDGYEEAGEEHADEADVAFLVDARHLHQRLGKLLNE